MEPPDWAEATLYCDDVVSKCWFVIGSKAVSISAIFESREDPGDEVAELKYKNKFDSSAAVA